MPNPTDPTDQTQRKKQAGFATASDLFSQFQANDTGGYITQEFQDFGLRLAHELNDLSHKSLYIKLAKEEKRGVLERALSFVKDSQAKSKARLFMWKLKQLKLEANQSEAEEGAKTPAPEQQSLL